MNDNRDSSQDGGVDRADLASVVDSSVLGGDRTGSLTAKFVDAASEAFVLVDESTEIRFANPAIEDVLGYDPDAIVGEPLITLVPDALEDEHLAGFRSYLKTGERTLDWDNIELPGRHRDGHDVPLLISFREFTQDDQRYFVGVIRDNSERVRRREKLSGEQALVDSMFEAIPDIVYAFDRNGQLLRWNEQVNRVTGYTDDEIESMEPLDFIPEEDHERVAASISRVLNDGTVEALESRFVTKDGTEIPYEFTGAPIVEDGEIIGETGVGRDITDRKRREERLERLNELNTVIRSVDQALVESTTRDEIARTVCDRLVDEGAYRGAIVGRFDEDAFGVDAAAGVHLSAVEVLAPSDEKIRSIAATAIESNTVQVLPGVPHSQVEPWKTDARQQRYGTVTAVPLSTDDRVFGVLGVYSDSSTGISDRERDVLGELGQTIGNAIQAALTHQLLYSNIATEIELLTTDDAVFYVPLSADAGCRLELNRALTFGDESVFYLTASGASVDRIRETAADLPVITSVDHLGSDGGEHRFEFRASDGTITTVLTDHGARTTAGQVEDGEARILAELPPDADVREVVDAVQAQFPETELAARRDVERSLRTAAEFRRELAADLTDKQRGALETAYFAGYFKWPTRQNNAEGVAETLDIAPQTFHQHLRIAEQKLLSALFDDDVDDRHS